MLKKIYEIKYDYLLTFSSSYKVRQKHYKSSIE